MTIMAAVGEEHGTSAVVKVAYDLGVAFDEDVVVLHVIPEDEAEAHLEEIHSVTEFQHMSFSHEEDRAASFAEVVVDNTLDDYDRDRVSTIGRIGAPADTILSVADSGEYDIRYLVIGGRKRSPVGKALFGSVTQEILLGTEKPVMTIME